LVDYEKKILYLREAYDEVWVNDLTPPTPTGGTWLEIFTNAYWKDDVDYLGGHFTWSGTEWEQLSSPYTGQLVPASAIGWHTGYRPDYMRITYSGPSTIRVRLKDEDGLSIADELTYSSGEIIELNWNDTDLAELEFQWEDTGLTITDTTIEFYQVDTVTGTTTSTTTTTTSSTTSSTSSSTASTVSTVSTASTVSTTTTTTSSTATTTTTVYPWLEFTSDAYWEHWPVAPWPDEVWTGTEWISENYACADCHWMEFITVGGWAAGFRPTSIRVTWSGPALNPAGDMNFSLHDTTDAVIASFSGVLSKPSFVLPITFGANDIWRFEFFTNNHPWGEFRVQKIEFLP